MEQLTLHTLADVCVIMESDIERRVIDVLGSGFDTFGNFIIAIDHIDEENPENECSLRLTIRSDEASELAQRLEEALPLLPRFLRESMEEWRKLCYPSLDDVRACFKELTECLLDEGCRFRISHTPSQSGYFME